MLQDLRNTLLRYYKNNLKDGYRQVSKSWSNRRSCYDLLTVFPRISGFDRSNSGELCGKRGRMRCRGLSVKNIAVLEIGHVPNDFAYRYRYVFRQYDIPGRLVPLVAIYA